MGWTPETFWKSTLHTFYRFALAYRKKEEADREVALRRMSFLMWAAGVTWRDGMDADRIYQIINPSVEQTDDGESPLEMLHQRLIEKKRASQA